jgi:SlyX protein
MIVERLAARPAPAGKRPPELKGNKMATEEHLIELEARIAHQDQSINDLSEEIYQQSKQLQQLEATCRLLLEKFQALSESGENPEHDTEPPPHY